MCFKYYRKHHCKNGNTFTGQGIKLYQVDYKTEEPSISFCLFRFIPFQTSVFMRCGLLLLHMVDNVSVNLLSEKEDSFIWRYDPVTAIKYAFIQKKFFMTLS